MIIRPNHGKVFERLADAYPNTDQARSGLFFAASAASNMNDPVGAERFMPDLPPPPRVTIKLRPISGSAN